MTHAFTRQGLAIVGAAAVLLGQVAVRPGGERPVAAQGTVGTVGVIVQQRDARDPGPARLVERLGGRVTRSLPIVDGFAATLPRDAVGKLAASDGVLGVVPDAEVRVAGTPHAVPAAAGRPAPRRVSPAGAGRVPAPPAGQLPAPVYRDVVGATRLNAQGRTGAGVTVAMIDTGVAKVADLAGRVVPVRDGLAGLLGGTAPCKNLSGEDGCGDDYGHGTFIAGLIAGDGRAGGGRFKGVAPGAKVLSVKIAGRDGSSDVGNLLAAIQWVVSHRQRYGIKVLNLALGTDSTQSYRIDPVNYAVERAWQAGITVIVAASNRGPGGRTIAKPGDDPFVVTVGATDDRGTATLRDDVVPDFSARGPTAADGLAKPDLVAPGALLPSLNAPGSMVDERFRVRGAYRRGSGTSMSTAVVSGVAALLLQAHPRATPDRVKHMLTATARPAASRDRLAVGAGLVDGWRAVNAAPPGLANRAATAGGRPGAPVARSLDPSRGRVLTRAGGPLGMVNSVLRGSLTATSAAWQPAWVLGPWTEDTWRRTAWQLRLILPTRWSGTDWSGRNWQWHGTSGRVRPPRTYGRSLPGSTWYGVWG